MVGGGSGHIFDMIARLKANEALRKKKSYFKTMQDYMHVTGGKKISIKEITKEELEAIRQKIKINRQKELRKTILVIIISVLLLPLLIWLIIKGITLVFI